MNVARFIRLTVLLCTIVSASSFCKADGYTFYPTIGINLMFTEKPMNSLELGLLYAKYEQPHGPGGTYGVRSTIECASVEGRPVAGVKVSGEISSILLLRIGLASYTDFNGKSNVVFCPETGISYFGHATLHVGWNLLFFGDRIGTGVFRLSASYTIL